MNKKIIVSLLLSGLCLTSMAKKQNEPIVMKINGNPITKSEFEYIYHKNNSASVADQKSLDDYVKLFVDYKLKVEEAKSQRLDTVASFQKEYMGYRAQLAEPYLTDTASEDELVKKCYDRLSEDFEVSHILIPFKKNKLLPADTLELYNQAMDVYQKITSHAMTFDEAANAYSSDKSNKVRPGYLGWTTANMFVEPFENAMYAMSVGEISKPVRTRFGYHIILLHNKRKDPGQARVAHIMFGTKADMTQEQLDSVKAEADKIYERLQAGEEFSALAKKYSFDKYSSEYGGEIGWVKVGSRFPTKWLEACLGIKKVNDFTQPIKTVYGYHIIKLNEKKPREPYAKEKAKLLKYVKNGDHKFDLTQLQIQKLKKDYSASVNSSTYATLKKLAESHFPLDSAFLNEAKALNQSLLEVDGENFTTAEFLQSLKKEKPRAGAVSTEFLDVVFDDFLLEKLKSAKEKHLAERYPDFRNLSNEYYDGILMFNIMNKEVWHKAEQDSSGLSDYFTSNKAKYAWTSPKHKGCVIHCKDEETMAKAKALVEQNKGAKDLPQIVSKLNDSVACVAIEVGTWGEGDNAFVDNKFYGKDIPQKKINKRFPQFFVEARTIDSPEEYSDVKGQVVSDYQDFLEKEWVKSLHNKYKVKINKKVLKTIQ